MSQLTKHASAPVDTANPWSDDVLKRRELAQQLTAALSTVTQPFVLGLHGEFDNGKTFFIKRWRQELLNAGDVAVYFNAWETDYAAEPLIAFTAAIKKQLEEHDLRAGQGAGKALALSAGRIVLKAVLPRAIGLATGGLFQASDVSALTAIGEQLAGATSDITDRAVEEAVKHYEQAQDEVKRFGSILADCAQAITERETGQVRRFIVFVDELDRCRPDYAVHVLECIKHFFEVDHVIFVIAIDRGALIESVRAVYGDCIDVDGYLRKFFDYNLELPPPAYGQFAQLLARSFRLEEAIPRRLNEWLTHFPRWCRALGLSLRIQEQILSQANFIVRGYGANRTWVIYDLTLILLCIRAKTARLFDRISTSNDQDRLHILLSEVENPVDDDESDGNVLDRDLRYGLSLLLAGFVTPEAIKAKHAALADRLNAQPAEELPVRDRQHLKEQMSALEQAFQIVDGHTHGELLGHRVVRDIRFLTS